MGARLLAGCLAVLLLLTLVGAGVLYFLQHQQGSEARKAHDRAIELFYQTKRKPKEPIDPSKQSEAIRIWREEAIPRAKNEPWLPEALYQVANVIAATDAETARLYYRRIVEQFPESDRYQEAKVRLAQYNIASQPEQAREVFAAIADSSASVELKAEAAWGLVQMEIQPDTEPAPEIRNKLQEIIRQYPDSSAAGKARKILNEVHRRLIFEDSGLNEFKQVHVVQRGDLMLKLANQYTTTVYIIEMMNGIKSSNLRPNQQIMVPTWGKVYAVVDKSDFLLMIYKEADNSFVLQYPVGIGKLEWKTKQGEYIITNKQFHPPWPDPKTGKMIKYGEEGYPLGERWLGLSPPDRPESRTGLGIHGTNEPESIGTASSLGCVRMTNEDVIEVFAILREKSRVIIRE